MQLIGIEARQKDKELIDGEEYIIEYEEKIKQDETFKTAQKVERENLKITVITKEGYIFEITEEDVEYIGKTNEDLSILNISIKCSEVSNKLSILTAEVNKNNDRKYDYKIYVNNKEIETITTKEKSFSYEIQTEFGKSQIYVKTIANDKEVQSNQVEIEDNSVRTIEELKKFRNEVNAGNTYEGKIITQIANIDMKNENWESKCYNEGNLTGIITSDYGRTCGISAFNYGGTIKACYNKGNVTTITDKHNARAGGITDTSADFNPHNSKTTSGIIEKSSEEMKKLETALGSDFKKDTNNINNGYPILYWQ